MDFYTTTPGKEWQNEVVKRAMAGERRPEIARAVGKPLDQVRSVVSYARTKGVEIPHIPTNTCDGSTKRKFALKAETVTQLERHANQRGTRPSMIARAIVETAIRDGLVEQLLDGGPHNG